MRIQRLNLLAYGHFTDASFDLPTAQLDLQIVYGQNEAGKSTALSAIEDLLFGIPHNTGNGFLHDYSSMRVGAVVEGPGGRFEFMRRKGTKNTLLDKDGVPFPAGETALAPLLKGAERAFYARMFCLDHTRLEQGGKEILEAQGDVGQILFSAGSGIVGLRERIKKLRADADTLWSSRRASHRKYYQAEDRLKAAESALREHTITASRWHDLSTTLEKASEAYRLWEAELEAKTAEGLRLSRIRRVYRNVQKHADLSRQINELGQVADLPKDAHERLQASLNDSSHAQTRLITLTERIDALRKERDALNFDEALLARGDDITQLHERRIQVRAHKADLPKRRIEFAAAEADLKRLAAELEWHLDDVDQVLERLPTRSKAASARALSKRCGELIKAEEACRSACEEADESVTTLNREIGEEGTAVDVTALVATLNAIRELGDISGQRATAEKSIHATAGTISRLQYSMRPFIPAGADVISMTVPSKNAIEHHRDRSRELAQRLRTCREQIRSTELLLKRHTQEYERTASDEHAVPEAELQRLRQHRDAGWSIIRRKYVERVTVSDAEVEAFQGDRALTEAYESAIEHADLASDQRFQRAEATSRLTEIARQIAEQREHLDELRGQETAYVNDEEALTDEWAALWKHLPIAAMTPDEMLVWIEIRAQIVTASDARDAAERDADTLRDKESNAKALLTEELDALGVDTNSLATRSLRVALELAADIRRQNEIKVVSRRKLEDALKKAKADAARKRKSQKEAEAALAEWKGQWNSTVALLGLNPNDAPETIDAQIDTIDAMRDVEGRINSLRRDRIEMIERDIADFEGKVAATVASIAPKLADMAPEDAVLELERALKDATSAQERAADADARLRDEQEKAEKCEQDKSEAQQVIADLQQKAGVSSVEDLTAAIRRSDELRSLRAALEEVTGALAKDGDGMPIAELADECAAVDLDQIAAREQTITQELSDLRPRLMEAQEERSTARRNFDAVGGDDHAARDAADRQAALSEMKDIAEEFIRLRSAELLLQWTVDRFRREKQAPLLTRAGELFAILTGGSFQDLRLEFDEHDKMELAGIRANGGKVKVSGMSTGSADQLYLALRVAAIEDYLSRNAPLPFIADDLFINFDNERAAAGFKVLAQLAQKTQVIFFTHHVHLLEIANTALGGKVSTIYLAPQVIHLDKERDEPYAPSACSATIWMRTARQSG